MGDFNIGDGNESRYNQKILTGCTILIGIFTFSLFALLIFAFNLDRQSAQYPGSIPISEHSNYRGLPRQYRWDNTYRTGDSFTRVYNWYSATFGLGAESRANGKCILLEGVNQQLVVNRQISVLLCNTGDTQMIYVSRFTTFR